MPPQLPPSLGGAPPMGSSPIGVPSGNAGSMAHAISQLREAAKIVEKVLPSFQIGTDKYRDVLSLLTSMNKLAPPSAEVPGMQQTTAAGLNADAQKAAAGMGLNAPAGASAGGGGGVASPAAPPSPAMPPSLAA